MQLVCEADLAEYLLESEIVNYSHPLVRKKAAELSAGLSDEIALVKAVYEYVRDKIPHTFDIQGSQVSCRASEVIGLGEGICYAKANLLAALLRACGIPAGFCYQRLTKGDSLDTGHGIHALNGVYLKTLGRWIRLDARGNKPGVNAQFSLEEELLAFPVRPECGEEEYAVIYSKPNPGTIEALKKSSNWAEIYDNMPDRL